MHENPTTKMNDSKKFRIAMKLCQPANVPCAVCDEEVAEFEMSQHRYQLNSTLFDAIFTDNTDRNERESILLTTNLRNRYLSTTNFHLIKICLCCEKELKNKRIPKNSLSNNLDFGLVPNELKGLSPQEQQMISIYVCSTTIVRMQRTDTSQLGTIGGIAYVMNDLATYCKTLPRPPEDLGIVYIRVLKPMLNGNDAIKSMWTFEIRPYKIREALLWLKANNPLYRDVNLNFDLLDSWATNSILDLNIRDVEVDMAMSSDDDRIIGNIEENLSREVLLENFDVTDSIKEVSLQLPSTSSILYPPHKTLPKDKVFMNDAPKKMFVKPYEDERFFEKAFPWLFPYGDGGPSNLLRPRKLSNAEYDAHTMRESSRRFSHCPIWMATRYRYRTNEACSYLAQHASANNLQRDITVRDLRELQEHTENGQKRNRFNKEMENLLKTIISHGKNMKTSFMYIKMRDVNS